MTFTNQTNRTSAVGSGSTGQEVAFSFYASATSNIKVYKRVIATGVPADLIETTNYTISLDGDDGGTLTTVTAIETTEQIHLVGNEPYTQTLDLEAGGPFNAENQEDAFDKNAKLAVQNKDRIDRAPKFPETDPTSSIGNWPNSIDRASKYAYFGDDGLPAAIAGVTPDDVTVSTFMETVLDDANGLAALNTLGGVYTYNVVTYGADPTGIADSTTYVQAAIDAAIAADQGIVYFPNGTYLLSNITCRDAENITFRGATVGSDTTSSGSVLDFENVTTGTAFRIGYIAGSGRARNIKLQDLTILDSSATSAVDIMLSIEGSAAESTGNFILENVDMTRYRNTSGIGIQLDNLSHVRMSSVRQGYQYGAQYGLVITTSENITSGVMTFEECYFNGSQTGLKMDADIQTMNGFTFIGCWIGNWDNANASESIELIGSISETTSLRQAQFINCHMENADAAEFAIVTLNGYFRCIAFDGCNLSGVSGQVPQYGFHFSEAIISASSFRNNVFESIKTSGNSGACYRFENDCVLVRTGPVVIDPTYRTTSAVLLEIEAGGNHDTIKGAIIDNTTRPFRISEVPIYEGEYLTYENEMLTLIK